MIEIVQYPCPVLRKCAEEITDFDDDIRALIVRMADAMHYASGIGLAAPQVNVSKRLFLVHTDAMNEYKVFINPVISACSQEVDSMQEGCLSFIGQVGDVTRSESIQVQAQDEYGKRFSLETSGLYARVILHELDHLNGVLFIDHLEEEARNAILASYT